MNLNATLFAQTFTFLLFLWFCFRFVWPPLEGAIKEREAKIAEGLAAGERGRQALMLAEEKAQGLLEQAKVEAQRLLEKARQQSHEWLKAAKEEGLLEQRRLLEAGERELVEKGKLERALLEKELARLVITGIRLLWAKEWKGAGAEEVSSWLARMGIRIESNR